MADTIIDFADPAIQAWQKNNMRLSLDGWSLRTDFTHDGVIHYAVKGDQRIDNTPPECSHE